MQETQCPQCGEWLGVPPEFADRAVKCGACGRVIQPYERAAEVPPPPPPTRPRFPQDDTPRSGGPRFPEHSSDHGDETPRRKGGGLLWLWLSLVLLGLGCCVCGGVGFFAFRAMNRWQPYTPDNGAFTAEFPGKPEYQTKPFKWKDGKEGTGHEYGAIQLMNAQGFGIHYADLPKSLKGLVSNETLLKLGREDFRANATKFTEHATTELTVGKYKAVDVEGTYTDPQHGLLQVYLRVIIVGDRVFTLVAAGKDKKRLSRDKDRFFNSFKPAEPKEAAAEPKEK